MDKLKEQFKQVIAHSQNIDNPKVDKIFNAWATNKKRFIDKWNGELQISLGKVNFSLDAESKESKFVSYCYYLWDILNNPDLANFVEANYAGFFENKVVSDRYTVPKGMKLLRAFKYFEKDKDKLRRAQDEASRVIQEDKVEGELIMSVHPLDYLSLSENTYKWRSCHALDGDFRAGNISYMMDQTTVVCYLKGSEDVKLPRFPESVKWNSKKWRVLLFFSDNGKMCFAGRQYPFSTKEGIDFVNENLHLALGEKDDWTKWQSDTYRNDYDTVMMPKNNYFSKEQPVDYFMNSPAYSSHYNDLVESSCYIPIYAIHKNKEYDEFPYFTIGARVPCLQCEELFVDECMLCYHCESEGYAVYCDNCGCRVCEGEGISLSDGDILCEDCAADHAYYCEDCHTWHYFDVPHKMLEDGSYVCLNED